MAGDAQIDRAIAVWRLGTIEEFLHARWYPPESFLEEHAAIGKSAPVVTGEPDFVKEHPALFSRRSWPSRVRPLTLDEIESLARIGTAEGPSVEEAVSLLRRVRRTPREIEVAQLVFLAPGPLPRPVR